MLILPSSRNARDSIKRFLISTFKRCPVIRHGCHKQIVPLWFPICNMGSLYGVLSCVFADSTTKSGTFSRNRLRRLEVCFPVFTIRYRCSGAVSVISWSCCTCLAFSLLCARLSSSLKMLENSPHPENYWGFACSGGMICIGLPLPAWRIPFACRIIAGC